jgi:hypothetical protein
MFTTKPVNSTYCSYETTLKATAIQRYSLSSSHQHLLYEARYTRNL